MSTYSSLIRKIVKTTSGHAKRNLVLLRTASAATINNNNAIPSTQRRHGSVNAAEKAHQETVKKEDEKHEHHDEHHHDNHHRDDHHHHEEEYYTDNDGRLFGEPKLPPGQKRKWESWEFMYYFGFLGGIALLIIGLAFKPDYSIQTWAREEALRRRRLRNKAAAEEAGSE